MKDNEADKAEDEKIAATSNNMNDGKDVGESHQEERQPCQQRPIHLESKSDADDNGETTSAVKEIETLVQEAALDHASSKSTSSNHDTIIHGSSSTTRNPPDGEHTSTDDQKPGSSRDSTTEGNSSSVGVKEHRGNAPQQEKQSPNVDKDQLTTEASTTRKGSEATKSLETRDDKQSVAPDPSNADVSMQEKSEETTKRKPSENDLRVSQHSSNLLSTEHATFPKQMEKHHPSEDLQTEVDAVTKTQNKPLHGEASIASNSTNPSRGTHKSHINPNRLPSKKRKASFSIDLSLASNLSPGSNPVQHQQYQPTRKLSGKDGDSSKRPRQDSILDKELTLDRQMQVGELTAGQNFKDKARTHSLAFSEDGMPRKGSLSQSGDGLARKNSLAFADDAILGAPIERVAIVGEYGRERLMSLGELTMGTAGSQEPLPMGKANMSSLRKDSLATSENLQSERRDRGISLGDFTFNITNSHEDTKELKQQSISNGIEAAASGSQRPRLGSMSSLDGDLAERKWSQDSTLPSFSPNKKDGGDGFVTVTESSALPKLDDILEDVVPGNVADTLDPITRPSLSMKASPSVAAIGLKTDTLPQTSSKNENGQNKAPSAEGKNPESKDRKESFSSSLASSAGEAAVAASNALEHFDSLASAGLKVDIDDEVATLPVPTKESKKSKKSGGEHARTENDADDSSKSISTHASREQQVLLEAIALTQNGNGSSQGNPRERFESISSHGLVTRQRDRLGSLGSVLDMGGGRRDRLESMGSALDMGGGRRDRLESMGSALDMGGGKRDRLESLGSALDMAGLTQGGRRERLESWGGMSDLSGMHVGGTGGDNGDFMAMAEEANLHDIDVPSSNTHSGSERIRRERERLHSIASLSEASLHGMPVAVGGIDVTVDIQAFVSATVESMGGQLAEIAGAVEMAAGIDNASGTDRMREGTDESELSSTASPLIGAASDKKTRARSLSVGSGILSVDHEALAAAVDAATAAASAFDLDNMERHSGSSVGSDNGKQRRDKHRVGRRQLPLSRVRGDSQIFDDKLISDIEKAKIRERARAAASAQNPLGKIGKSKAKVRAKAKPKVAKKRTKQKSPSPEKVVSGSPSDSCTPRHSNRATVQPDSMGSAPIVPSLAKPKAKPKTKTPAKDKGNQKWDNMFDHLIKFINAAREKETKGFSAEEKRSWAWDGNVPTNYKTDDGKALGRWVNNQRTAKTKGTLKDERIKRLEDAGLKWSVLSSNSWNDTLEELRIYVREKTKNGGQWDGNVPTNYQIKARPDGQFAGEDRNLGRWVNRQRSLFQAGKLRKDRKESLEQLGLKWSMLDSTTWEAMFDNLLVYIKEKKRTTGEWDGNVPANYKTPDDPPRALGRWINRQRSAHVKRKLKREHVEKLSAVGLKWSVHERQARELEEMDQREAAAAAAAAAQNPKDEAEDQRDSPLRPDAEPLSSSSLPIEGQSLPV